MISPEVAYGSSPCYDHLPGPGSISGENLLDKSFNDTRFGDKRTKA
jgi:hypothetical protein